MSNKGKSNGRVIRRQESGLLHQGFPSVSSGKTFSLAGWGSKTTLADVGVGLTHDTPQLWLCGGADSFPPVWQRLVVAGTDPHTIHRNGRVVGVHYEDSYAEYCLLTGILPTDLKASRDHQTTSLFENIEDALKDARMSFSHVVRTWLYMDKILEWYDVFNQTRDAFFRSRNVYQGLVPASTGIGSANMSGSAIAACAMAVKPKSDHVSIHAVPSPLQCAALEYGSSFSRAVEIATPEYRTLMVSGTASIAPGGATVHVDDVEKQIALTMDVVEAILVSRGMNWSDATRAIMYLKKPEFLGPWQAWLTARNLTQMPLINVEADVCRDDLLVELELDAAKAMA